MGDLSVQLLGHFSATQNGVALTQLNTSRRQALFAYLILDPHPHFRYHLAYLFWPDSSESQARTNLRNLLHHLRQALPDFDRLIQSEPQTLQWRDDAPYMLDVREFEQLLAFSAASSLVQERLVQAVALYQGDLLPDCYDDWITSKREALRRAYLAALEALAEITEDSRDYAAALQYTHRLLQEELLHPGAHRRLIRLHALTGNQPAALGAYQAYATLLDRELGLPPDQEAQDQYIRLKNPIQREKPVTPRVLLVGRQAEWRKLQAQWRRAAGGNPQAVLVTGEAGIGKTRLVEELVQWASLQGLRTAVAHCYPAEGRLPYAPVVSWLRSRPLPRLENVWLTELSRLLPEVLSTHPNLAPPQPLTEAWQRQRMFEALARAALGEQRASLLVIEDIHWCDQDTLEWLHYLLRYEARSPVLLVATERCEETTAPDHPVKKLRMALATTDKLSEIELKSLNEAECFQLAAKVAEAETLQVLGPDMAAHIYRETEGNPLFVVEMVRLGRPLQTLAQPADGSASLSEKVYTVLKWRIEQLTPATRELASLAATLGREFRLDVLLEASSLDESALVAALNELIQRRIVHEQTPDRYDFTHDKLRQVVFSGLSSAHRRLLHRRAAEAYLRLSGTAQPRSAEIASHYEAAGLALPAIQYYRLASQAAADIFSNGEAIRWLRPAIALAETALPGSDHVEQSIEELACLYESLGELLALTGDYQLAQAAFLKALAQPFHQRRLWQGALYRKISGVQFSLYRYADAEASLDVGDRCLELDGGPSNLAERQEWLNLQLARGQFYYWCNRWPEMNLIAQKIQPELEGYGSRHQRIELLDLLLMHQYRFENYHLSPETVALAHREHDLAVATGDIYQIAYSNFQVGFALLWHGEPERALPYLTAGLTSAEAVGQRTVQGRCLAYATVCNRQLKQIETVRSQTEQLYQLATAIGEHSYVGVAWANRAWLAWLAGDQEQAAQAGQAALDHWLPYPLTYPFHWLAFWPMLALAHSQDRLEDAERCARGMLDPKQRSLDEPLPRLLGAARQACQAEDRAQAWSLFDQALQQAQELRYL
jgi:DNA-binding SARP family transcriptional activator